MWAAHDFDGTHLSALDATQLSGNLSHVASERAQDGLAPFMIQPSGKLVRCEEVQGDVASRCKSLCEVHLSSQVPFGRAQLVGLAGVHLLFQREAGLGVTRDPYLDPVPGQFAGHVLSDGHLPRDDRGKERRGGKKKKNLGSNTKKKNNKKDEMR